MTPDNQIIPITEDDQGEGYKDPLTIDDMYEATKFDDTDLARKLEKLMQRKANLKPNHQRPQRI